MKLTIELVPSTSWYSNVRSEVTQEQWDTIRKRCYKKANYICEICGGKGPKWPVECHEIWHYNDQLKVQALKGFIALCPNCHKVKHIGRTKVTSSPKEWANVIKHFMNVNSLTHGQTEDYIRKSFNQWRERSEYDWYINISFLNKINQPQIT